MDFKEFGPLINNQLNDVILLEGQRHYLPRKRLQSRQQQIHPRPTRTIRRRRRN